MSSSSPRSLISFPSRLTFVLHTFKGFVHPFVLGLEMNCDLFREMYHLSLIRLSKLSGNSCIHSQVHVRKLLHIPYPILAGPSLTCCHHVPCENDWNPFWIELVVVGLKNTFAPNGMAFPLKSSPVIRFHAESPSPSTSSMFRLCVTQFSAKLQYCW